MHRNIGCLLLIIVLSGACKMERVYMDEQNNSQKSEDLYEQYRKGSLYKGHPRTYLWELVDEMIDLKIERNILDGMNWNDLKSRNLIKTSTLMFVAPGPMKDQVFVGFILSPASDGVQEVELIDLDGRGALIKLSKGIVSELMSVTGHIAFGGIQPEGMNYPEDERKASLLAFWSAIEGIEWEPLEERYRAWIRKIPEIKM